MLLWGITQILLWGYNLHPITELEVEKLFIFMREMLKQNKQQKKKK